MVSVVLSHIASVALTLCITDDSFPGESLGLQARLAPVAERTEFRSRG